VAIAVGVGVAIMVAGVAAAQVITPARDANAKRTAQSMASRMIGAFRAPPGAKLSAANPGPRTLLGRAAQTPATPNLVDRHRFWRVPGTSDDALHWVQSHLPAGAHQVTSGSGGGPGGPSVFFVGYGLPAGSRAIASRELLVAVASRRAGTAMRVDAQVIWLTTRPASERIPAGVTAVTAVVQSPGQPGSPPQTFTDAAKVARIVALVDRLPAAQPGAYACPADAGPVVDLGFTSGGTNPRRLATARADAGGCGEVSLTIGGKREPALSGGRRLIDQLHSQLGLSLG
jgi:hypothetical protein